MTGGIACGKSLLSHYLNAFGIETLDADDVVHELIPPDERRRLASVVFRDEAARRALEARIHPLVRERIANFFAKGATENKICVAVIPLLFEVNWQSDFDIILCVAADRSKQIERMVTTRGYTREEAESRLAAQLDVAVKAQKSHYVIWNNGTSDELKDAVCRFVIWLKKELNDE